MKNLIIFVFLVIITEVPTTVKSGIITYKLKLTEDVFPESKIKSTENPRVRQYMQNFNYNNSVYLNKYEYALKFTESESLFYTSSSPTELDDSSLNQVELISESDKRFYTNSTDGQIIEEKEVFDYKFRIFSSNSKWKWKLKNESKKISGYQCFKATTTLITKNAKGTFNKEIVAWYAPELPFNFGPKDYSGLPGLILELTVGKRLYYVEKIKFNPKKKVKIEKPNKGKIVTYKELDSLMIVLRDKVYSNARNKN